MAASHPHGDFPYLLPVVWFDPSGCHAKHFMHGHDAKIELNVLSLQSGTYLLLHYKPHSRHEPSCQFGRASRPS